MDFEFYSTTYNTFGPLDPSFHEMRYKPFLGSMNPKTQKMRKQRGRSVESGKYEWEWYDDLQGYPPVATLSKGDQLTRIPCQPPK